MELKDRQVPIVETFASIQGEGPRLRPAIFIRSALCCFKCPGFCCHRSAPDGTDIVGCDTIRAVSAKFRNEWTYYSDYKDLVQHVNGLINTDLKHPGRIQDIIWTGGEPLMYWNTKVMQNTLAYYISRGHHVTIETNAALDIDFFREYQKKIMFSMSVKLSNSGELKDRRINIETITKIVENCPESYLKFVVDPKTWETDSKEIFEIFDALPYYVPVYLMPLGGDQEELQRNTQFVVEKCIEYGFNYSDRIHIRAFNTKEGV